MIKKTNTAILFDLGGLFINIDYQKTIEAFKNLGIENFNELYSKAQQSNLFDLLETAKISNEEFIASIQKISGKKLSEKAILSAWNAMLLSWNEKNLSLLPILHKKYSLYLFSNTNALHKKAFLELLEKQTGLKTIEHLFDKTYYSHECGFRKPDVSSFQKILSENKLEAKNLQFYDDSIQHILAAQSIGINAVHVETNEFLGKYFQ